LSFFDDVDEADEPVREPRSTPRRPQAAPRRPRGRPPGSTGRPPGGQNQQVQQRRLIAGGVLVVIVIVMVLLINGCEASQNTSSLKSYASNVYNLVQSSDTNGRNMFADLRSGEGKNDVDSLQQQVNAALSTAGANLRNTEGLSAPGAMATAQQNLVTVMRLRHDGIAQIAANIQDALSSTTSEDGVYALSQGTSELYASDVIYKTYVGTAIAGALHGDGLVVGGTDGIQINAGQIVPDLGWLQQNNIGEWIGATLPTKVANGPCANTCGHALASVSVGSTTLVSGVTNTIPASPAPVFQLTVTNSGQSTEYDVECKVDVAGDETATATVPKTAPGGTYTCTVPLKSPPTPGQYKVTAEVVPVTGETNTQNNSLNFSVTFN
jgi:hypothetical protein